MSNDFVDAATIWREYYGESSVQGVGMARKSRLPRGANCS